jgi:hypothetical protein
LEKVLPEEQSPHCVFADAVGREVTPLPAIQVRTDPQALPSSAAENVLPTAHPAQVALVVVFGVLLTPSPTPQVLQVWQAAPPVEYFPLLQALQLVPDMPPEPQLQPVPPS